MGRKKDWIKKAITTPGSLGKKALAAGLTIEEYCAQKNLSPDDQKRCTLRQTLMKFQNNKIK